MEQKDDFSVPGAQKDKNPGSRKVLIFAIAIPVVVISLGVAVMFVLVNRLKQYESVSETEFDLPYTYPALELKFVESDEEKVKQALAGNIPAEYGLLDNPDSTEKILVQKNAVMVLDDYLKGAAYEFDRYNIPVITIHLNKTGAKEFAKLTEENAGKKLAILFNGKVLSAPIIREPILTGTMQITGAFSIEEARKMQNTLRFVIKNKGKMRE